MSSIGRMPFNVIEDYVDELEEKIKKMEVEILDCRSIIKCVAYELNINPKTPEFELAPVSVIASVIEELQNAQTTKQA